MKQLEGRVAVVTGGGSGIGRATCLALAGRGLDVAVVDLRPDGAQQTADMVRSSGRDASVHLADVADRTRMHDLADEVADRHGAVHVLVNNAGVTSAGRFEDESPDDLDWIVGINVWGVVHGCRFFLPHLRRADEAHIVNMSSMVGLLGLGSNASYSLTKGAVRSFSEALRAELRGSGIGLTVMHPGAVHTSIATSARGAEAERLHRMGSSRLAPVLMRPPTSVARRIVKAVEHDRARAVVGPDAHLVDAFARLVPSRSGLVGRLTNRLSER